jgi:hypothetical protein
VLIHNGSTKAQTDYASTRQSNHEHHQQATRRRQIFQAPDRLCTSTTVGSASHSYVRRSIDLFVAIHDSCPTSRPLCSPCVSGIYQGGSTAMYPCIFYPRLLGGLCFGLVHAAVRCPFQNCIALLLVVYEYICNHNLTSKENPSEQK